jgi:hypothetical protein
LQTQHEIHSLMSSWGSSATKTSAMAVHLAPLSHRSVFVLLCLPAHFCSRCWWLSSRKRSNGSKTGPSVTLKNIQKCSARATRSSLPSCSPMASSNVFSGASFQLELCWWFVARDRTVTVLSRWRDTNMIRKLCCTHTHTQLSPAFVTTHDTWYVF